MERKLVYLHFLCRIVVCDKNIEDEKTHDLREYARITPKTEPIGGIWLTKFDFAGTIEWTEYANLLTEDERKEIELKAKGIADTYKEETQRAKNLQAFQRKRYAKEISEFES